MKKKLKDIDKEIVYFTWKNHYVKNMLVQPFRDV